MTSLLNRSLAGTPARLLERPEVAARLDGWQPGRALWIDGVWGPVRGIAAAMLASRVSRLLVVLPDAASPDILATDLKSFGVDGALAFPLSADTETPESLRDQDYAERLRIVKRLIDGPRAPDERLVIAASVPALLQPVPAPPALQSATLTLAVGSTLDDEALRRWLTEQGFHATSAVDLPGEFAMRGGILDIFSPDQDQPVRIELFGDEIESIRRFDPASQLSTESVDRIELAAVGTHPSEQGSLVDYLGAGEAGVLVIEPAACQRTAEAFLDRVARADRFESWHAFLSHCSGLPLAMAESLSETAAEGTLALPSHSVESFVGDLDTARTRIDTVGAGHEVVVVADTPADAERMTELMSGVAAVREGRLSIEVANLSGGFRLSDPAVLVLTGAELFHRSPVRQRTTRHARSRPIDSFSALKAGDLVVHLAHGIGLYRGLELIEKHGTRQEHLTIEFDGGTKVFVPAAKIGLVQRYVGGTKSRPRLAKIGGQSWIRQKKAAQQAVTDMASELLEVQAARSSRVGIAFNSDSDWQRQFDASFPYTETPDQLAAIRAAKADMESIKPMDRLICGDVGYGKTEVAMRAAFKAVDSGYQVAVLVPTTVLAEQHFKTFSDRMAEFPFDIAKLSRFGSTQDHRSVLAGLEKGSVDIVIGTHRLASADVKFFNLGLLIVDEEQRFGVEVKEKLKQKHSNVDVLTLSATPIPRTLHMSLVGVRDISNLETAPEERLSVETKVTRWNEDLIRRAIVRELNRNGQVFMVHNRIGDIGVVRDKLRRIVPEAKIGIGHGQMHEEDLARVMLQFIEGEIDVLLATTIIESGLDIPNANTMFVDEADRYGLADLHQLRGRVGRYKHQAYCYMLVDRRKHLTPQAAKRLRAIEEYSQMGAGFQIAMRDLEIRGAGNLLGTQQSGHIAAVGYELYCQLLEDAVRALKHLPPRRSVDVEVDLPVDAYLPTDYVGDLRQKIDLYRRMNRLDDVQQIADIRDELRDRFGPIPRPAERMLELAELRLDAAVWQVAGLSSTEGFLVLRYSNSGRIEHLKRTAPLPVRIVDAQRAYVPIDGPIDGAGEGWLEAARSVLRAR